MTGLRRIQIRFEMGRPNAGALLFIIIVMLHQFDEQEKVAVHIEKLKHFKIPLEIF